MTSTSRLSVALIAASTASVGVSPAPAQPAFVNVTEEAGLGSYVASTGDGHGPGGVFADLNNDGFPDLYLMRARDQHGLHPSTNQFYLNVSAPDGSRHFVLVPFTGTEDPGDATGAIAGDYDNDGDVDLYVLNFDQPNVLLRNLLTETGLLLFVDVTEQTDPTPDVADDQFGVGIAVFDGVPLDNSLSAAWADPDRDGDLDLYVGNHNGYAGDVPEGPFAVPGRRDVFYLNNGDGTFTDATMESGVPGWVSEQGAFQTSNQRFSSTNAVIFANFNNDRWPDLLVTNKIGGPPDRDMLYINLGRDAGGHWLGFQTVTYDLFPPFGAASGAAMGVDVADIDNDGDLDIYITDWSDPSVPASPGQNDLWFNLLSETGEMFFVLAADAAPQFDAPAKFSWGAQFQDFNNDGLADLHVATEFPFRDFFYLNGGDGFLEIAQKVGLAQRRSSHGDMSADYNRDGWADLFVVNIDGGASALFENNIAALPQAGANFLTVKLVGDPLAPSELKSTRDAIGARVVVGADLNADGVIDEYEYQTREVVSGSSNAGSTSSLDLEFGLGHAFAAEVFVLWPSGDESAVVVAANTHLTIEEGVSPCLGDLTGDGTVDVRDFFAFVTAFASGDPASDLNGDGSVDVGDFFAFVVAFSAGCP